MCHWGDRRVAHDLDQTGAVAQVNKDHPTMITQTMHPPAEDYFVSHQVGTQRPAVVGATHMPKKIQLLHTILLW
jgi:hypothetical protein